MSTPTPSLQSVAEAAAKEISSRKHMPDDVRWTVEKLDAAILTRHFAPLLAQYEQRVRELEGELEQMGGVLDSTRELSINAMNQVREAAGAPRSQDDKTTMRAVDYVAALRTRCAELEEDKAALNAYVKLLLEELDETVPLAAAHGWKSTRYEAGVKCRAAIAARTKETTQ